MQDIKTMKAFVLPHRDAQTVEPARVPVPRIGSDELLVRVHAIGVGIHDSYFLPGDAQYPYPIGIEAAGVVEQVGNDVTSHAVGDRVSFVSAMQPGGGTWAQWTAVKAESMILPIPQGMGFVAAAAVPVAGNTALKALHTVADVPAGGSLFIAGGSGAIGTFAIQLARQRGLRVAASASAANHDYLQSIGVEKAVDYHDSRWREEVLAWMPGGVSAVMAVQPGTTADSLPVLRDGGTLVSISGDPLVSERGAHLTGLPYQLDVGAELGKLMEQIASGQVHLELERVYPFDEALDALAKVQTRRARGKVVLQLE